MATRSTIAIAREDGTVAKVYAHWDGYLENNGDLLIKFYNTAEKVEELIALGDISSLNIEIGIKHPFGYDYNKPGDSEEWNRLYGDMTTFYGRDRGEEGTEAVVFDSIESYETTAQFEEFNYLFIGGRWYYKSYDGLVRDVEKQLVVNRLKEKEPA